MAAQTFVLDMKFCIVTPPHNPIVTASDGLSVHVNGIKKWFVLFPLPIDLKRPIGGSVIFAL